MVSPTRRRTATQPWLIAIAVVAVLVVGFFLVRSATGEEVESDFQGQPAAPAPSTAEVATFNVGGVAAKCARPVEAEFLQEADAVFEATVTSLSDGGAKLEVTRNFLGESGPEVQLRQRPGFSEALSGSGDFTVGRSYLITASDGDVADCLSGPADDEALLNDYQHAFPGSH